MSSNKLSSNDDLLIVDGYLVDEKGDIDYPILGKINTLDHNEQELADKITLLLVNGGHLTNPHVKVKRVNSKFTILGEVNSPGTYSYYDNQVNIFQALGFAGDLLITAKRNSITLIREENGLRKTYKFSLNEKKIIEMQYYRLKNNDILIIEPNFSSIKSAGFIGNPSSIASISSLLLSITLLIINN